ncbi:hypothetical protein ID866_13026 [Astraeus odoratus]|nr:hypothetical protein ID866_13026 [Astraeus odoratus]
MLSYTMDDDTLSFIPSANSTASLIPASLAHNKANIIQDEHLSFKQFSQATLCMITFMQDCGWDQMHVEMHICFWSTIENHKWHNSLNKNQQCALLTYQGRLQHKWHICITSPHAFDLTIINETQLSEIYNNLASQASQTQHPDLVHSVSTSPISAEAFPILILTLSPTTLSHHFPPTPHLCAPCTQCSWVPTLCSQPPTSGPQCDWTVLPPFSVTTPCAPAQPIK